MTFGIAWSPDDKNVKNPDIKLGEYVAYYNNQNKRIFYGKVTNRERKTEAGELSYTATDNMMHLLRSSGTYKFYNKSPENIAKVVCADAKVPVGSLAKTKLSIPKIYFEERPFYEIIMAGYTKANAKNGKQYIVQMDGLKLSVIEKGKVISDFWIRQGERIIDSSYSETLDEMVNRVAIYDGTGNKIGTISNDGWIKSYGVFQGALTAESGNGKAEAKNMLTGITRTASINAIGDSRCVSGMGLIIKDYKSGLNGKFWIENDTHTWENNAYTMSLELTFKNIMDKQEEDEWPEKPQESATDGMYVAGTGGILNGQRVKAKFTAYYPANNAMEGGFLDAIGNKLNPAHNTMAAPPSISFHTDIQILGTGTNRDGQTYEVLDRGGAIQIEGGNVYHFDILMSSAAECNSWGVRMGEAIIGDGTGYSQQATGGSGSALGQQAVALMKSLLRKNQYTQSSLRENVWSGYGDCSSTVWKVYERLGVFVGTYTGDQVTRGTQVDCVTQHPGQGWPDESKLQLGDLIFFGGGGATHVEMYTGPGECTGHGSGIGPNVHELRSYCLSHPSGYYQTRRYV